MRPCSAVWRSDDNELGNSGEAGHRRWSENEVVQAALQVLAGEPPGEWRAEREVPIAERVDALDELLQVGAVVRCKHFLWMIEK